MAASSIYIHMTQKIKAVGHKILIKYQEVQEKMAGGIVLPDTATTDRTLTAEVLDVGSGYVGVDGVIPMPIHLEVGNVIIVAKHAGHEVKFNGEKYQIIAPEEVLGIVY